MPLLSRYSRDGSCPEPPVARMPGLHQIKNFSLPRIHLSRNSICSLLVPSPPLLFGRHQISRDKQFCAKEGGEEISFAPLDLQNLFTAPSTGFKTIWNRSSLTSEINRSTRLECVTGEASWTITKLSGGNGLMISILKQIELIRNQMRETESKVLCPYHCKSVSLRIFTSVSKTSGENAIQMFDVTYR
ncbi:hypothetical protein CEXT_595571 [Caerostris extrusa]|uniref:Uncharacterized protein n=1 Tax=Caerostris extrusa TaxID=172846 RepID=A0AAV4XZX4_CAEEX|nr:hypothetical protein CEXT_595571 [Caerostris extrusa]